MQRSGVVFGQFELEPKCCFKPYLTPKRILLFFYKVSSSLIALDHTARCENVFLFRVQR